MNQVASSLRGEYQRIHHTTLTTVSPTEHIKDPPLCAVAKKAAKPKIS